MVREIRLSARLAWILGLASLGPSGCRDADFLYHEVVSAPRTVEMTRKVRQMQAGSRVDILWVIDNSGSMLTYQRQVADNTELFMREFAKLSRLRWRMGLVSTDTSDAPFLGFESPFEWNSPNAAETFRSAVAALGISGSGTEKSFAPVLQAIESHPDFNRPEVQLAIILVTDAEEQSNLPAAQFLAELARLRGRSDELLAYGVFGADDLGCGAGNGEGRWNYAGSPYEGVISSVQGKVYPICRPFGPSLTALAQDLSERVNNSVIYLADRPDPATIAVRYRGRVIPGGSRAEGGYWRYDYDRVALVFHDLSFAPGKQEEVDISFERAKGADPVAMAR